MKNNIINLAKSLENLIEERKTLMRAYTETRDKDLASQVLEMGRDISNLQRMMVNEIASERWAKYSYNGDDSVRVGDVIYMYTSVGRFIRIEIDKVPKLEKR